ncbi:MAG: DUF4293 domain-containing protein [Bacteroidaceae bacterium]|nr:DUF4293 domain-containing protein [Bacteroidaceae bacterium]
MIQRIQTLYLFLACVLCVFCMTQPVGYYFSEQGCQMAVMNNLLLRYTPQLVDTGVQAEHFITVPMFVVLLIVSSLSFFNIFLFRRRALQMRVCSFSIILLVAWYALYAFYIYRQCNGLEASFRPGWAAALPFCAIVLLYLAFRGILKDEMLVKSLDRLR